MGKPEKKVRGSGPKINIKDLDSSDDEIVEEYVSIKRKPPKLKQKHFSCKVCDMVFSSGTKVSAHVFIFHLRRMSDKIWSDLYTHGNNLKVCNLCGDKQEKTNMARLHQYSEHKRELKKKMEEKGEDWRNLLDFIQFKVSEEMINNEEVTESEIENSCPVEEDDIPLIIDEEVTEVVVKNDSQIEVYDNPFYEDIVKKDLQASDPITSSSGISASAVMPENIATSFSIGESDSDEGVKVCMERSDVTAKKSSAAVDVHKANIDKSETAH